MTHGYAMPLYLWIGIIALCLSVAIPAVVGMVRKHRVVPAHSPQDVRDQITALAGDLCGYLIALSKKLYVPPDPTAVYNIMPDPDEPEIVESFERRFGDRLRTARTGLGNVGMLLSNIGDVLENGATNADSVRRIIECLEDSVRLLDTRCGTKATQAK